MKDMTLDREATHVLPAAGKPSTASAGAATPAAPGRLVHEDIALRAYQIYVAHGRQADRCQENWLRAEHELGNGGATKGSATPTAASPAGAAGFTANARPAAVLAAPGSDGGDPS